MWVILSYDDRSDFHDDVIKWKYFPRYWPFVRGIHRSPVNSPHKGQWRGALMFTLMCARINGWVNNREAGDLRRYRTHYDVIVMWRKHILSYLSGAETRIFGASHAGFRHNRLIHRIIGLSILKQNDNKKMWWGIFYMDIFSFIRLCVLEHRDVQVSASASWRYIDTFYRVHIWHCRDYWWD